MSILDRLGLSPRRAVDLFQTGVIDLGVKSPWSEGSLTAISFSDLIGKDIADQFPMGRGDAIKIPAVSKARNLLVSTIAKFPLVALDKTGPVADQPAWLYRTNGNVSPYERMAWTVDDAIFYGSSMWLTDRGAGGQITDAYWCPPQDWKVTDGHILVNDEDVDENDFILFNFPFEGLLNIGSTTLKGARDTERAWTGRMRNPIPMVELHVTDDSNLTQDEVNDYVKAWAAARRQDDGAVGFTPQGIEIRTHGEIVADLYTEARNAIRTDVGSFLNVSAAMLDGTTGIDSLTYTTKDGERNGFYEFGLPFWTDPIQAALSQDKAVPRGQRVRFDKYAEYGTPIATDVPVED